MSFHLKGTVLWGLHVTCEYNCGEEVECVCVCVYLSTYIQRLGQRRGVWGGETGVQTGATDKTLKGCACSERGLGLFLQVMGTPKYFEHCSMLEKAVPKRILQLESMDHTVKLFYVVFLKCTSHAYIFIVNNLCIA